MQGDVAGRLTVRSFRAPRRWARLGCPVRIGFPFPLPFRPCVDRGLERGVAFFLKISNATSFGGPSELSSEE